MFGGNSNWRGPVWIPLNYLAIRQFVIYQRFFGNDFKLEYPTGSGEQRTFGEVAQDLADRIIAIWLPDPNGRRPLFGGSKGCRPTRPGRTTSSSTSTSTATTVPASARRIRPDGRRSSST